MSNKEQSSAEWLFKQLWDEPQDKFTWYAILRQAKAKHEQEIVNAWEKGNHKEMRGGKYLKPLATQYYNETFNSDED
jgi:hypothetical protein